MFALNIKPASPLLFSYEPFNAVCDYVAGYCANVDETLAGDGHPVLVLPGLGQNGGATAALRAKLLKLGYAPYDWCLGINHGPATDIATLTDALKAQLGQIAVRHACRASLIGLSLGGMYARTLAEVCPEFVRQVITLGTPYAHPERRSAVSVSQAFYPSGSGVPDRRVAVASAATAPVSTVSIYSQLDGIVHWQSCIGRTAPSHRNAEVAGASHFGLVHNPEVFRVIAEQLQHVGQR